MKLALVIFFIFTTSSEAYVHPILRDFVRTSNEEVLIEGRVKVEMKKKRSLSCQGITARLKRLEGLREELNLLERRDFDELDEMISYLEMKSFIQDQAMSFYEVSLENQVNKLSVNTENLQYDEKDFIFAVYGGEALLSFAQDSNKLKVMIGKIEMYTSNYQYCLDQSLSVFFVKDCRAKKFSELHTCLGKKVLKYKYLVPRSIIQDGTIRRDRW